MGISIDELLAAIRHIELPEGPTTLREFCRAMGISESTLARRFVCDREYKLRTGWQPVGNCPIGEVWRRRTERPVCIQEEHQRPLPGQSLYSFDKVLVEYSHERDALYRIFRPRRCRIGPMPLDLADIHLHCARLFRNKPDLANSRTLIEKHGHERRIVELKDAEAAARNWPP